MQKPVRDGIKLNRKNFLVILLLFVLCFLLSTGFSSYIFCPKAPQLDSSVFRYVGMVMRSGGVPYRDTFDHKGPLIYLINYLGLFFGQNGIWFFELLFLVVTAITTYALIKTFCSEELSFVGTCFVMLQMYDWLGAGNYTEEYALPFITISLLIFVDYYRNNQSAWWKIVICGGCFASVLMLRPNMIGTWCVFCTEIFIRTLKSNPKKLISFIGFFLAGIIIVFLPFIIYLSVKDALRDFWEQYVVFNIAYTEMRSDSKTTAILYFMGSKQCVSSLLITIVCILTKKTHTHNEIDFISLIYIIVSVILIGVSGRKYNHYGIILAPLTIIPYSRLLQFLEQRTGRRKLTVASIVVLLILMYPWCYTLKNSKLVSPPEQSIEGIISAYIKNNTDEDDAIIQCGHKDIFYILSQRKAASKYSYPLPIAMIDSKVYDEFFNDLKENPPAVIIADSWTEQEQLDYSEMNRRLEEYVEENNYIKGKKLNNYTLYYPKDSRFANIAADNDGNNTTSYDNSD